MGPYLWARIRNLRPKTKTLIVKAKTLIVVVSPSRLQPKKMVNLLRSLQVYTQVVLTDSACTLTGFQEIRRDRASGSRKLRKRLREARRHRRCRRPKQGNVTRFPFAIVDLIDLQKGGSAFTSHIDLLVRKLHVCLQCLIVF